jgi:hypothetical protein
VDTLGGWHPSALSIITRLGCQVASNVGKEGQEVMRHLRQRLAVLLVRDNVAMLCARTPTAPTPCLKMMAIPSKSSNLGLLTISR